MHRNVPPISQLREIAQREKTNADPRLSYRLFRFVSIYITRAILFTSITATQVTVLSILIGLIGMLLIANQAQAVSVVGFMLMFFYHLLDKVDGEIARFRNHHSIYGIYLDNIGHYITSGGLVIAAAFRLATLSEMPMVVFLIGVIGGVASILSRVEKHAPFHLYSQYVMESPGLVDSLPAQSSTLTRESIRAVRKQGRLAILRHGPVAILRELVLTLTSFPVSALILVIGVITEIITGATNYSVAALVFVSATHAFALIGIEVANLSQNLVAETKRLRESTLTESNRRTEST